MMAHAFLQGLCERLERMSLSLPDPRARHRVTRAGLGLLCGEAPKTITSALEWNGARGDWSAEYRLFSKTRWNSEDLFQPILAEAVARTDSGPIYAAIDDTLVRKTGRNIPGTSYARDPLSPPFRINLVLGQRFLQTSVMARAGKDRPWRSIPVAFRHAPPLKAPPRATPAEKEAVRKARKRWNISAMAREELHRLRAQLDALPDGRNRVLLMTGDGSFANRSFLTDIPKGVTLVVRMRKNARLRKPLPNDQRVGNRKYGAPLPTPDEMLRSRRIRKRTLSVTVSGRRRTLKYKVVRNVCWPHTTKDRKATMILIHPLRYRLRAGGKLLYKQPAYLYVIGEPVKIIDAIIAYLLRWGIEVNFRDEKTILGVGNAQVWNPQSVARAPAFLVACYAALLLTSMAILNDERTDVFDPLPPWRKDKVRHPSTRDLIRLLRKQILQARKTEQADRIS